jgi:hypothetical protein
VFTIALELPSLRRCFHILVSTRSQESRGRLPLHAGERFDGEYRLLTGEDSECHAAIGCMPPASAFCHSEPQDFIPTHIRYSWTDAALLRLLGQDLVHESGENLD